MTPIQTTVSFDMRAPGFGTPTQKLYAAALEMAAYADSIGVDRIALYGTYARGNALGPSEALAGMIDLVAHKRHVGHAHIDMRNLRHGIRQSIARVQRGLHCGLGRADRRMGLHAGPHDEKVRTVQRARQRAQIRPAGPHPAIGS